jgi:hypothetical protein
MLSLFFSTWWICFALKGKPNMLLTYWNIIKFPTLKIRVNIKMLSKEILVCPEVFMVIICLCQYSIGMPRQGMTQTEIHSRQFGEWLVIVTRHTRPQLVIKTCIHLKIPLPIRVSRPRLGGFCHTCDSVCHRQMVSQLWFRAFVTRLGGGQNQLENFIGGGGS